MQSSNPNECHNFNWSAHDTELCDVLGDYVARFLEDKWELAELAYDLACINKEFAATFKPVAAKWNAHFDVPGMWETNERLIREVELSSEDPDVDYIKHSKLDCRQRAHQSRLNTVLGGFKTSKGESCVLAFTNLFESQPSITPECFRDHRFMAHYWKGVCMQSSSNSTLDNWTARRFPRGDMRLVNFGCTNKIAYVSIQRYDATTITKNQLLSVCDSPRLSPNESVAMLTARVMINQLRVARPDSQALIKHARRNFTGSWRLHLTPSGLVGEDQSLAGRLKLSPKAMSAIREKVHMEWRRSGF